MKITQKLYRQGFLKHLKGKRFGKLVVIKRAEPPPQKTTPDKRGPFWLARCDCGNEVIVPQFRLRNGKHKSCGCLTRSVLNK